MRSIVLSLTLLVVPLGIACDKPGVESRQGADKGEPAQSDLEKTRDEYRHQKQADLASIDKTIADVESEEKTGSAKAKAEVNGMLTSLKSQRAAFAADLAEADTSTAATWDSAKARLDKEWDALKAASDKAVSTATADLTAIYKPAQMTCEDFVAVAEVDRPKIVYWGEGFNKNGQAVDSVVDVTQTDRQLPVMVSDCAKTPTASLTKVVQQHTAAAPKPAATAPAPTKMTCEQFVALDDVTKQGLVYWAAGFNAPSGGAGTNPVLDVSATDKLVPVLVAECSATPKLTFWQKVKNYF